MEGKGLSPVVTTENCGYQGNGTGQIYAGSEPYKQGGNSKGSVGRSVS